MKARKWRVCEFAAVSSCHYPNPYWDVELRAEFIHTDSGAIHNVRGYYDGEQGEKGHKWKIRWTPIHDGEWTCRMLSIPEDGELADVFQVIVAPAEKVSKGFLRADPARPFGFKFDNGEPFFLFGDTQYNLFGAHYCGVDVGSLMKHRKSQGINYIRARLQVSPYHPDVPNHWQSRDCWPWGGSAQSPDFMRLNLSYFNAVDEVVALASEHGIGLEMILQGWMFEFPFNDRGKFIAEYEQFWHEYIIARYASYDSVYLWCPANEYEFYPTGTAGKYNKESNRWLKRISRHIRSEDPYAHPIGAHNWEKSIPLHERLGDCDQIEVYLVQTNWGEETQNGQQDASLCKGLERDMRVHSRHSGKVAVCAEFGYERTEGLFTAPWHQRMDQHHTRRGQWRAGFSGHAVVHGFDNTWGAHMRMDKDSLGAAYLQHYYRFMTEIVSFDSLSPAPEQLNTASGIEEEGTLPLCLSDVGGTVILVYFPTTGTCELTASPAEGGECRWYNPRTGELNVSFPYTSRVFATPVSAEQSESEVPGGEDWVLLLVRSTQSPQSSNGFETRCLHSLTKVFADEELVVAPFLEASALHNETYSFQVAFRSAKVCEVRVRIESELEDIKLHLAALVPVPFPAYDDHDGYALRTLPGLYPDPLIPLDHSSRLAAYPGQWQSIWVMVHLHEGIPAGRKPIVVAFDSMDGEVIRSQVFMLDVIGVSLPKQRLLHTEWFHTDCLATHYGVEVFSDRHWELISRYMRTAVENGMNMILTPLFTPPLDTAIGGERLTVQLVDIERTTEGYRFGFESLKRWADLCRINGVEVLEFAHFFTQWGAKHAPKIMAKVDGHYQRIFGWETNAEGEEYSEFLDAFLPKLSAWIRQNDWHKNCYFHISDEPNVEDLASYERARQTLTKWLADYPMIDALSDYAFYEKGLVKQPVVANDHMSPFVENKVSPLWTYYCCAQYKKVSNRFVNMPSARCRILGFQLYKYGIRGFLHWGYNFWYSRLSRAAINPYQMVYEGEAFPTGDAYVVYPGKDGPVESIRLKLMLEAMQDLRALELLGDILGREALIRLLEEECGSVTFEDYPRDSSWLLRQREWINRRIQAHLGG